jgi:hypothetical protein
MKAVQRSNTRYVVYKQSAVAWQIICHVGDRKWHVHSWRGDYLPGRGYATPDEAAAAQGLEITEWADHEEKEVTSPVARARAVIGSVLGRNKEQSKT